MTNQDLYGLYNALMPLGNVLMNEKFEYAVRKNIQAIVPKLRELQVLQQPLSEYTKYEEEKEQIRIKVLEEFADKDEKGGIICINENKEVIAKDAENAQYKLTEDNLKLAEVEIKKNYKELDEKYREVIAKQKENKKNFFEILNSETDVKIHKIEEEFFVIKKGEVAPNQMIVVEKFMVNKKS
jgi:DnaJ-domain-containing protein 1